MWWPAPLANWYEAHNSAGATSTATRWAIAEGETGGARGVDTYILLANPTSTAASIKVTLLFEDGTTTDRTFAVAANSRFNVWTRAEFPSTLDRRYGAIIESLGASAPGVIVERAMYFLGRGHLNAKAFLEQIKRLLAANNVDRAKKLCEATACLLYTSDAADE